MKVRHLINKLEKFDDQAEVQIHLNGDNFREIRAVANLTINVGKKKKDKDGNDILDKRIVLSDVELHKEKNDNLIIEPEETA